MVSKLLKHPNKKSKQAEIAIGHLLLSHVSRTSSLSKVGLGAIALQLALGEAFWSCANERKFMERRMLIESSKR
jgi:hypothetical protein